MLTDSGRSCDACGAAIADGEKYFRQTVSSLAEALRNAKVGAATEPAFVINDDGSVTMELCQSCSAGSR